MEKAPMVGKNDGGLPAILRERDFEQREMSRFLHDTIAQDLVALSFTISRLESLSVFDAARGDIESAGALISACCRQVRIVDAILASSNPDGGAPEALIENLAELVRAETGIPIALDLDPPSPLSRDTRILLVTVVRSWCALAVRRRIQPAILIRLRNRRNRVVLDLEMSPPPPGSAEGWTLFRGCAITLGGDLSVTHSSERLTASLSLPENAPA
jgi:signal transduction histidine kinase